MIERKKRTALQRTYINYQEWARDNNIYQTIIPLNPVIYGFVYLSSTHKYFIIINKNLTLELQKEVFMHEVEHIMYDMPEIGYFIGVDMQYSKMEKQADEFIKETAANFFK
jgi:Zn-dependent peptidase ImmA (M78 family)